MVVYDEPIYNKNSLAKIVEIKNINYGHSIYVTITNISLKGSDRAVPSSMDSFRLTRKFKLVEYQEDFENAKRYIILKQSYPKANLKVQVSYNDLMKLRECMENRIDYFAR